MINVGLIGAGKIVETFHLPAWQEVPGARVSAIADPRTAAAGALASRFAIANVFDTAEAMIIDGGLDAVDICSPHSLHAEHACTALRAGLHCVIEKPFATTSREADAIAEAAREAEKTVMCAQHQRFRPPSRWLKSLIEAGELGEVYTVRVDAMSARGIPRQSANSFTDRVTSHGGPLMDQGAHGLDIAWWFLGCPRPLTAHAVTSDIAAPSEGRTMEGAEWTIYTVEDFAAGLLTFQGGKSISIHTSYYANCREDRFSCEILGTRAGIVWPELDITRADGDGTRTIRLDAPDDRLASIEELRHFTALIRGEESPVVTLDQSVAMVRMIEALYISAHQSTLIRL